MRVEYINGRTVVMGLPQDPEEAYAGLEERNPYIEECIRQGLPLPAGMPVGDIEDVVD